MSREYGKVSPKFWTGGTGKELRKQGPETVIVALYLMTSPMSNMLGIYCQPLLYMAHETGLGIEGVRKGLQRCIEGGFCKYDEESEVVWVIEMATFQIAASLKASDNQCAGIQKAYLALEKSPFLGEFFDKYQRAFHLKIRRGNEVPSDPLPSQEQEKEQEQEQEQEQESLLLSPDGDASDNVKQHPAHQRLASAVLAAYHEALPNCRHIEVLTPKRQRRIQLADKMARQVCRQQGWEYDPKTFWEAYFAQCQDDPWLRGEVPNPRNATWKQNLDVLLAEDRFADIMDRAIAAMRADSKAVQ